jgi:hypothetical protein
MGLIVVVVFCFLGKNCSMFCFFEDEIFPLYTAMCTAHISLIQFGGKLYPPRDPLLSILLFTSNSFITEILLFPIFFFFSILSPKPIRTIHDVRFSLHQYEPFMILGFRMLTKYLRSKFKKPS